LAKLDPGCSFAWAFSPALSVQGEFEVADVVARADGLCIAGGFKGRVAFPGAILESDFSEALVAKLDASGKAIWAISSKGRRIPGASARATAVSSDGGGSSYVVGTFSGEIQLGGSTLAAEGAAEVFAAKVDSNGNFVWAAIPEKARGGVGEGTAIAVDAAGSVYVLASFPGDTSLSVVKLNTAGGRVWSASAKAVGWTVVELNPSALAIDEHQDSYVAGSYGGDMKLGSITLDGLPFADHREHMFVAKLDPSGSFVWARSTAPEDHVSARGIAVDSRGDAYLTGSFTGRATFGAIALTATRDDKGGSGPSDVFVAKIDGNGRFAWALSGGGPGRDEGASIAVDGTGKLHVTGAFSLAAEIGGTALDSKGSHDVFVVRLPSAH
jgi:hypothetical protein